MYHLQSCANCHRHVWPVEVTDSLSCPICSNERKCIVDYVPITANHAHAFAGDIQFCQLFNNYQDEIMNDENLKSENLKDWYSGDLGHAILQRFDRKQTIFIGLGYDGLARSRSSKMDCWPIIVKTA
jgi:hypothetical protein